MFALTLAVTASNNAIAIRRLPAGPRALINGCLIQAQQYQWKGFLLPSVTQLFTIPV